MNWPWVSRKRFDAQVKAGMESTARWMSSSSAAENLAAKHERNSKTLQAVIGTLRAELSAKKADVKTLEVKVEELTAQITKTAMSKGAFNPRRVPFHAAGGAKDQLENAAFEESVEGRKQRAADAVLGATNNG